VRILLAIPSLRGGGSERVMATLAAHWAQSGHDVALASFDPPDTDFFALDSRVRRFVVGESGLAGANWVHANAARVRAFRAAVREAQPEVILSFLYTMNLLVIVAARGQGVPIVVAERTDPRYFPVEPWQAALRRVLYRTAAALVVQTEDVLEGWARRMIRRSRAFAIPNPVVALQPAAWSGLPLPEPFIASVGRLEQGKGFDVLLDAFARVAPRHPEWALVVLGEGPERESLLAQAEALGVADRVLLAGVGDAAGLYARAGMFATATRLEGFPNALLEAMASGLPVVATDCHSGPREIVRDGVDGYLVPVDDAAAFATALDRLLGDEELRRGFATRARDVLQRFAIDRVAAQWEEVFARAAGGR
jgi:GalNAc-alpha-(1->4)-GalNAc-alpha-(1->3)-diNAcBac-PP-undecaprenol alpha-1,4-N-acetyl-D-galactosaminyltransferase